jgi:hypothetical protein
MGGSYRATCRGRSSGGPRECGPSLLLTAAIIVLVLAPSALARITRANVPPSETWSPLLPLTIGQSFEFETNREQSEYAFPLLVEYNFSEYFKVTIEPNFSVIDSKSADVRSIGGLGDLETAFEWEFIHERRYRPGVTLQGGVRWPTHRDPDLGNPGQDYFVGFIFSKDFVFADVDLTFVYTWSGDPEEQDTLEVALTAEIPLNKYWTIEAEIDQTYHLRGGGADTEATLGLAWHVTEQLKLEVGGLLRDDGSWQFLAAWEWSFSGD